MHALIEQARRRVDAAELYWERRRSTAVGYQNYQLQGISEEDLSSVAVRVIDRGRMGAAFGVVPDAERLLADAASAAAHGDRATFAFAGAASYPPVDHFDPAAANLGSDELVERCESIVERVRRELPGIALRVHAESRTEHRRIETTGGAAGEDRATGLSIAFGAPFQGVGVGVYKSAQSTSPFEIGDESIAEFVEWYRWGDAVSTPSTGRLPVLLAPDAAYLLLLPLLFGLSGDAVRKGTSPLIGRIGAPILSEALTIVDDPLRPGDPESRPFDDEGVPCARRVLVERGHLVDYILDLESAAALGRPSTGNGLKRALFGAGTELPPTPWLVSPEIEPGTTPWREIVAALDEGLLVTGGMGFHSGNYPQGQFAVQAIGFHIRRGRVVGRLDRTMISGNIYQDLREVRAVSAERRQALSGLLAGGWAPFLLIDSLQVTGR